MFTPEVYNVAEGDVLMVCLQLSGANAPTQAEISVEFSTVADGSATRKYPVVVYKIGSQVLSFT